MADWFDFTESSLPQRIVASIGGMLINVAGSVAGRVMAALGISVTTFTGIGASFEWLKEQMLEALAGVPKEIIELLAFMKIGTCVNIIITAIAVRMAITGMTSEALKKWVLTKFS